MLGWNKEQIWEQIELCKNLIKLTDSGIYSSRFLINFVIIIQSTTQKVQSEGWYGLSSPLGFSAVMSATSLIDWIHLVLYRMLSLNRMTSSAKTYIKTYFIDGLHDSFINLKMLFSFMTNTVFYETLVLCCTLNGR